MRYFPLMVLLVCVLLSACEGRELTSPTSTPTASTAEPLRLGLSGQSNAGRIKPFLDERAAVAVYSAYAGIAISPCWDNIPAHDNSYDGRCWSEIKAQLAAARVDAFVWWHGDADDVGSPYGARIADLFQRVRAEAKNPRLPIVILQLGAVNSEEPDSPSGQARAWAQSDPDAIYVETRDKEYQADRQHMTDQGYRDVSARIVAAIRARRWDGG